MTFEVFSPKKEEVASIRRFKISLHRIRDIVIPISYEEDGQRYASVTSLCCNDKDYSKHLKEDSQPRCVVCNYGFEYGDHYFYAYKNRYNQLCIREKATYDKACLKCGLKQLAKITPKTLLQQYRDYVKTLLPKN